MTTATVRATEMTAASLPSPPRRLRSIAAVTGGLVAVAALSSAVDAVLHATGVYPAAGKPMAAGLYLLATAYRAAFQIAGGYLTARLAPRRPMKHVLVLGIVGLVLSAAGVAVAATAPELGPLWYPFGLFALALPTVWAGGKLGAGPGGAA